MKLCTSKQARWMIFLIAWSVISCKQPSTDADQNLGTQDPTPSTLPTQIKVVVFASKCPLPTDCDSNYIEQASKDVAALQPDLVIATEFFWKKENYTQFAKKIGLPYYTRGPGASQDAVTGGVVLLSRFPFSEVITDEFKNATLPDNLVKKGTVIGKIRLGKNRSGQAISINLIGTHFQAKATGDWAGTQALQAAQQAQFLKDRMDSSALAILGGDFNIAQQIPDWLCADDACRSTVTATWNRILDQIITPHRFLSASQLCVDNESTQSCVSQNFNEIGEQRSEVMKLFVSNTTSYSSQSVSLVPRKLESFQTISDHRTWRGTFQVVE